MLLKFGRCKNILSSNICILKCNSTKAPLIFGYKNTVRRYLPINTRKKHMRKSYIVPKQCKFLLYIIT